VSDEPIGVEVDGAVATITINRPERRNAVDLATAEALAAALDRLDADASVRVAILCGAGGTFCAGMDLKAFAETGQRPVTASRGGLGMVRRPPLKPIIAAVRGYVLGGGLELALACDLIVASQNSTFGLPEVRRGLVATGGAAMHLVRQIPYHVALELLLTGEPIAAARAYEIGLVSRVVPDADLLQAANELASLIAAGAPLALMATKRLAVLSREWTNDEEFDRQEIIVDPVRRSNDAREGAAAFRDHRAPTWSGS
jgi:enoyl-CoA hydratase/crotonobetainyl-CoA hydratase